MIGLVARVRGVVGRRGARGAVEQGLRRLAAPLCETGTLVFFVRDLAAALPEAPVVPGYRARQATIGELAALREGSDPGRSTASLRERFRRGHQCFVVVDEAGRFRHTRWVTTDPAYIPEVGRRLRLAAGDAYFYDGYTHPAARGKGLDGVVRCAIFAALAARGMRRAVSYVRADNPAGLRAAARWQRPVGRIRYLRLVGRDLRPLGAAGLAPLQFEEERAAALDEEEHARRAARWQQWFASWLGTPLDRRSTGFSALPEAYFVATAKFVAEALELGSGRLSLLDVGCSSAGVSGRLGPAVGRLTGVDGTTGLLADAARAGYLSAGGRPARFAAADGRRLPFRTAAFDRVSCLSTLHTLASHEDAERAIDELLRVCAPGGRVLLGGLPDRARRWRARIEAWRRGDARARCELVAAVVVPGALRSLLRRWARLPPSGRLIFLEFDLAALARRLERAGYACRARPFPRDFWSRDFRLTRSNLVIEVPVRRPVAEFGPAAQRAAGVGKATISEPTAAAGAKSAR